MTTSMIEWHRTMRSPLTTSTERECAFLLVCQRSVVSHHSHTHALWRFWKLAPCDVEARVRRLKWAQTLVQDPSHHAQVLTAMFGKLPAEPSATLNP